LGADLYSRFLVSAKKSQFFVLCHFDQLTFPKNWHFRQRTICRPINFGRCATRHECPVLLTVASSYKHWVEA
jgi:hypothetical protein